MPNPTTIARIRALEVLNFRGNPTVEVEVLLTGGASGRGVVAAGISAGINEVGQLLDADPERYAGGGALKAVANVNDVIAPAIAGMDACDQCAVDSRMLELDGTPDKSRLGANAILAVSLATARAAAAGRGIPLFRHLGGDGPFRLPVPAFDTLCGGSHAEGGVDLQEYLVMPVGMPTFQEALHAGAAVYRALVELLREKGHNVRLASGPVSPALGSNREAMEILMQAIEKAGYRLGEEVFVGLDAAMSELHSDGKYVLGRDGRTLSAEEMAEMWAEWLDDYPIVSIEDGMSEEDWDGWQLLAECVGDRVQLVGDDFFTTNPARVRRGVELGAANAVLVKPNQIGSLSETLETIRIATDAGWAAMPSSRSGEAEDSTIAHLATLPGVGQIKIAPPCLQTVVKCNELLRIADDLGDDAEYAGRSAFRTWA